MLCTPLLFLNRAFGGRGARGYCQFHLQVMDVLSYGVYGVLQCLTVSLIFCGVVWCLMMVHYVCICSGHLHGI